MAHIDDSTCFPTAGRCLVATGLLALLAVSLPCRTALAQQPNPDDIGTHLQAIQQLANQMLAASRAAEQAETVSEIKAHTDEVFSAVWGASSGLENESARGALYAHGWKTRWQTTPADYDSSYQARYGSAPPEITDASKLGIVGRGRFVRKRLQAVVDDSTASDAERRAARRVIAPLNNVIGWMALDDGYKGDELQPRIDLTREWDAPTAFWRSTSDTGWLHKAYAQAANILKTDYDGDAAMARQHAAALTTLIEQFLRGRDANNDGTIAPAKMEGGLETALRQAKQAGYLSQSSEQEMDG